MRKHKQRLSSYTKFFFLYRFIKVDGVVKVWDVQQPREAIGWHSVVWNFVISIRVVFKQTLLYVFAFGIVWFIAQSNPKVLIYI